MSPRQVTVYETQTPDGWDGLGMILHPVIDQMAVLLISVYRLVDNVGKSDYHTSRTTNGHTCWTDSNAYTCHFYID